MRFYYFSLFSWMAYAVVVSVGIVLLWNNVIRRLQSRDAARSGFQGLSKRAKEGYAGDNKTLERLREQVTGAMPLGIRFTLPTGLLVLVSLVCVSEANGQLLDRVRYPSKDSGMLARSHDRHGLNWLDNERIVFIGSKPGETRVERGREFPRNDLFVWKIATGEILRHAELSNTSGICVAPGYVRYHFERDGVPHVRFGEFGRTNEVELDIQAMKDGILTVGPVSCREYNPKLLKRRYGDWALPLLEPGEYLDRTSRHYAEPMRYFPEDGTDPIPLPKIPNRDVISIPEYSTYLGKYVFNELRRRSGPEFTQRLWVLDRQGKVDEIVLPAGPWMAGSVRGVPARGGWIVRSHALDLGRGFGAAGVYLIEGNKVTRLMTGYPHALAVSPDGCKVATSIEVKRTEVARPTVWMIDLCAKGQ